MLKPFRRCQANYLKNLVIGLFMVGMTYHPVAALAQDADVSRETTVLAIEKMFLVKNLLSTEGPMLRSIIEPLKRRNTKFSETDWQNFATELQDKLLSEFLRPQGAFDRGFRKSLEGFSDEELTKLLGVLNDPILERFKQSQTSSVMRGAINNAMVESADGVNDAIGQVAHSHHLILP